LIYEVINLPKKLEIALLDKAISFACDYLDLDVDLAIDFIPMKKYHFGLCDYDEEEIIISIGKALPKKDMIRTLFHELVHVKQHSDGRLQNGSPQRWLGQVYEDDYNKLPWEVEAFDLEKKMMEAFYS
jgi:hypothetical protein